MATKMISLNLGTVLGDPPEYSTGWYKDPITGQLYYYDATTMKWYIYAAGVLQPLSIAEQSAPKQVNIKAGDSLKISISYKYAGPAVTGVIEYFSIGIKGVTGYGPKLVGQNSRNLPICGSPTTFTAEKTLLIPTSVEEDWQHIECKVYHGSPSVPETGLRYINALVVVGIEAKITEFTIVDYVKA